MFGKKKQVRLELIKEDAYYRLTVDYFNVKGQSEIRKAICEYLAETYGELFLQVDSNFLNKKNNGRESEWVEALLKWAQNEGLTVESLAFKREVSTTVLGSMLGSRTPVPGYRVGMMLKAPHVEEMMARHDAIELGHHLGCGIYEGVRETLLKEFCAGYVNEGNFEKYYEVDFYDYEMVGRSVLRSAGIEPLEKAKAELEARFLCFNSN